MNGSSIEICGSSSAQPMEKLGQGWGGGGGTGSWCFGKLVPLFPPAGPKVLAETESSLLSPLSWEKFSSPNLARDSHLQQTVPRPSKSRAADGSFHSMEEILVGNGMAVTQQLQAVCVVWHHMCPQSCVLRGSVLGKDYRCLNL